MSEGIFDRRVATVLSWTAGLALVITLFFMIFSDSSTKSEDSWQADSFSPSAIGHQALTQLLDSQVKVLISRHSSAAKASPERPLLLLEPPADDASLDQLRRMVTTALGREAAVVLALPKRTGLRSPEQPRWLSTAALVPENIPRRVLTAAIEAATEFAPDVPAGVKTGVGIRRVPTGDERLWWARFSGSREETIPALLEPQLIHEEGYRLQPLIVSDDGMLLAQLEATGLYMIGDPDLYNNFGLGRGDNAVLAYRFLVEHLAPEALIVDETLHGFQHVSSVWRALLEMPLSAFSLHLAGLAALILWSGSGRFGPPDRPPSRVPPGKRTLVDNTARLFGLREHLDRTLENYFRLSVSRVATRMRLASGGDLTRQIERLAKLGRARGIGIDLKQLAGTVLGPRPAGGDPRRVLTLTRRIHRWQKEMLNADLGRPPHR